MRRGPDFEQPSGGVLGRQVPAMGSLPKGGRREDLFATHEARLRIERQAEERARAVIRFGDQIGNAYADFVSSPDPSDSLEKRLVYSIAHALGNVDVDIRAGGVRALVDLTQRVTPHNHREPRYR